MTTLAAPNTAHRGAKRTLGPAKALGLAGFLGVTVSAVLCQEVFRSAEAWLAATWLDLFLPGGCVAAGTGYMISESPQGPILFRITAECTSLVLIVPILLVGAALLLHRSTTVRRVLVAAVTAAVALSVVNQARLGLIAWATQTWGLDTGYEISHKLVGSIIGLLGFVAALLAALKIVGLRRGR